MPDPRDNPSPANPSRATAAPEIRARKPVIIIDADTELTERERVRQRLKSELADLHDHAAFDTISAADDYGKASNLDPELDHVNTRRITHAKVATVRRAVVSTGGQFILGLVAAIVGLGLAVYAAAEQSLPLLIAAGLIAPPCTYYGYRKYRQWLQNKRYLVRLLESLGEDVSNLT